MELDPQPRVEYHYLLVCKDGTRAQARTVQQAMEQINGATKSKVMLSYRVHPDTVVTAFGIIKYPDGFPPEEIGLWKGKEWTAVD